jgi:hypothetical protein
VGVVDGLGSVLSVAKNYTSHDSQHHRSHEHANDSFCHHIILHGILSPWRDAGS